MGVPIILECYTSFKKESVKEENLFLFFSCRIDSTHKSVKDILLNMDKLGDIYEKYIANEEAFTRTVVDSKGIAKRLLRINKDLDFLIKVREYIKEKAILKTNIGFISPRKLKVFSDETKNRILFLKRKYSNKKIAEYLNHTSKIDKNLIDERIEAIEKRIERCENTLDFKTLYKNVEEGLDISYLDKEKKDIKIHKFLEEEQKVHKYKLLTIFRKYKYVEDLETGEFFDLIKMNCMHLSDDYKKKIENEKNKADYKLEVAYSMRGL